MGQLSPPESRITKLETKSLLPRLAHGNSTGHVPVRCGLSARVAKLHAERARDENMRTVAQDLYQKLVAVRGKRGRGIPAHTLANGSVMGIRETHYVGKHVKPSKTTQQPA